MIERFNRRRRRRSAGRIGLAALLLVGIPGCSEPPPAAPATEQARPARILEIGTDAAASTQRFPGRVRAAERADLSFGVAGRLVELPVKEGDRVAAGALIARLEPANFQSRLAAAEAEHEKARLDYERVNRVWEQSRAVARQEVDQKRAAYEVARSNLAAARKELADARLTAPFEGVIVHRHVQNFRSVQANEPIVSLQNPRELEVVIHVPERIVRAGARGGAGFATFDDLPERRFAVQMKAFAAEADPQTQTYEVILALERPDDVTILPGMSATVVPGGAGTDPSTGEVLVPISAVAPGPAGEPRVWVVDPESSRVAPRDVVTGPVRDDRVVVSRGLAPGDRIVTTGVGALRDGMLVRPL